MAEERPNEFPEWGSDSDALIKAPSIEKRKKGYSIDSSTGLPDIPSLKGENWFRNLVFKWIKYFDYKISNINSKIDYFSISGEQQSELDKWVNLNEFNVPKGKWLFFISFRHAIIRQNQSTATDILPFFVSGIYDQREINKKINPDNLKRSYEEIMSISGVGKNLYTSYLAKEYDQNFGTAVENIAFSCVIDVAIDTKYYVKNLCFISTNNTEVYKNFYQINAIKIG